MDNGTLIKVTDEFSDFFNQIGTVIGFKPAKSSVMLDKVQVQFENDIRPDGTQDTRVFTTDRIAVIK